MSLMRLYGVVHDLAFVAHSEARVASQKLSLVLLLGVWCDCCRAGDVAGNYITYYTPSIPGLTFNSGTTFNNAASGDGYTAIGSYSLNADTFDFILKTQPNGSPVWSYQFDDPTGGAILRHTESDRIVATTYFSNIDKTEFLQFLPGLGGSAPVLEYAMESSGNVRFSSTFRFLDAGIYYLASSDGTAQLAKYGSDGNLLAAREFRLESLDGMTLFDMSQVRWRETRDSLVLTFQSDAGEPGKTGQHFARIDRPTLDVRWLKQFLMDSDDVPVFLSTQIKSGKHMYFADNSGLNPDNQFRLASLKVSDGTLKGGIVTGANRNPPAAVFGDRANVFVMGDRDQAGGDGVYFTGVWSDADFTSFTGIEFRAKDDRVHSLFGAGFSYSGRLNLEFRTRFQNNSLIQRWTAALDLAEPEDGLAWQDSFSSFTKIGGYQFNFGLVPIFQFRDTTENRLEFGHVNENLGIGLDRFESPGISLSTESITVGYAPFRLEALDGRLLVSEDITEQFETPLTLKMPPTSSLLDLDWDVTTSNPAAEPMVTVEDLDHKINGTETELAVTVRVTEPATVVLSELSDLDGRKRLVGQQTLLPGLPAFSHIFDFPVERDRGFGLIQVVRPHVVEEDPVE